MQVISTWIFLSFETPGLFYRPVTSKSTLIYLEPVSQTERCIQKYFLNVTDYLPCYLIFKRMVSVLVVVMVKGLGILREFSKTSESEAVDVNVLVFTIEETADCVFISANI